jgi:SAM-dependent methyltransferase
MPIKWYQNWFNSPYYHILYHQRNDEEAEYFIDNLCALLKPAKGSKMLDIACGRGRHSVYLNKKGYDVTGIDLSYSNVKFAKQFENENLHFFEHDMRHLLNINYFDLALNMFTSFGYFETERDHVNSLKSFRKSLTPNGLLVLDYFNTEKIKKNLTRQEVKEIDGIEFNISKKILNGKIVKSIAFENKGKDFHFKEEVKAFGMADFKRLFELSGFAISGIYGDYSLSPFDENKSDRVIFICKKADA